MLKHLILKGLPQSLRLAGGLAFATVFNQSRLTNVRLWLMYSALTVSTCNTYRKEEQAGGGDLIVVTKVL